MGGAAVLTGVLVVTAPVLADRDPSGPGSAHVPEGDASTEMVDTLAVWDMRGDPGSADPVERGAYLARVGNCVVCHTADPDDSTDFLAGGKAIESPFGTFYGTNITPHPEHGIGDWTEEELARSLREGVGADGEHLYPSFPYTSFTGMTDPDIADLYAFLQSVPAVDRENQPHDISWIAGFRRGLAVWKALNFQEWRFEVDPDRDEEWNRGAYLSRAVAHCSECHSPRTVTGGIIEEFRYAGTPEGADGEKVPNITPHEDTGLTGWSERNLMRYLQIGMMPDGDFAGGSMAEVISEGTSYLTDDDRRALVRYILSLEPIEHDVD